MANEYEKELSNPTPPVKAFGGLSGAAGGMIIGALVGSPELGAILGGALPTLSEETILSLKRFIDRFSDRLIRNWDMSIRLSGRSAEAFTDLAFVDDVSIRMSTHYVRAAAESENEDWIKSLSLAYVRGVLATDVDDRHFFLRVIETLAQLDPIDARLLGVMTTSDRGWHKRRADKDNKALEYMVEHVEGIERYVDSVVARLVTLGAITDGGGDAMGMSIGSSWSITPFGRGCVEAMQEIGDMEQKNWLSE